jgi:competence protein ComGC
MEIEMNKKGLTFMQFAISVICLSIVLIIMWPKIDKIIENSYEKIFSNKVKDMISSVGKTYVTDQSRNYSNVVAGGKILKDVNEKYQYVIYLNGTGKVSSFKVTNGDYKIEGSNPDGVDPTEVGKSYKIVHATKKYKLTSKGEFVEE